MTTPCTADWSALRIISSTSIQAVVTSALLHLSNPGSGPLILHTLPSPRATISGHKTAKSNERRHQQHQRSNSKNALAGLGKLVSVVEIVKRSFEDHQRESWRLDDDRKSRQSEKGKSKLKSGRKRSRDEAEEKGSEELQRQDGDAAVADGNDMEKKSAADVDGDKVRPKRIMLRLYQYNILDCYERLEASTSGSGAIQQANASKDSDGSVLSDNSSEASENEGDDVGAEKSASSLTDPKAKRALDDAILSHVVQGRKRPRKKHTPYLFVVLSSTRLPTYERELSQVKIDYTLQLPSRTKRYRKRRKKDGHPGKETQAKDEAMTVTEVEDTERDAQAAVGAKETLARDTDQHITESVQRQASGDLSAAETFATDVPVENTKVTISDSQHSATTINSITTPITNGSFPLATAPEAPTEVRTNVETND